jgi:hypothetical protein
MSGPPGARITMAVMRAGTVLMAFHLCGLGGSALF